MNTAEIAEEWFRERARNNLINFCQYAIKKFETANHHRVIARYLDRWIKGEIKRLMIFAPPRHGKSLLVSQCLPALIFGQNPDAQIIGASHTKRLATKLAIKLQSTMDSAKYAELFPHVTLKIRGKKSSPIEVRKSDEFNIIGHDGKFSCYGVGSAIVGEGFQYGIIDDPIGSREEAYSPVQRDKVNDWYATEFTSRMAPNARILIMHMRWHPQDLAGFMQELQAENEDADKWNIVSFPAVSDKDHTPTEDDPRQPGEPLWKERYPIEYLNARKAENTDSDWLAIYQQRPTAEGGNRFKTEWFDTIWVWKESQGDPRGKIAIRKRDLRWQEWAVSDCSIFGMVDPAATIKPSSDDTAIGAFLQTPDGDLCVIDIDSGKVALEQIPHKIKNYAFEHRLMWVGVEANGFQVTIATETRRLNTVPIRELSHRGKGKLTRAYPALIMGSNGQIVLPEKAKWKRWLLEQLAEFSGLEGDEDDAVDILSYAALEMNTRQRQPIEGTKPPIPVPPSRLPDPDKPKMVPMPEPSSAPRRKLFGG